MPSIVQFMHPGPEHFPDRPNNDFLDWNSIKHKRKFLKSYGNYIEDDILVRNKELMFWAEWEPRTNATELSRPMNYDNVPNPLYPRWLYSRILPVNVPDNFGGLQNTDPYVFDGPFRYFLCLQSVPTNGSSSRVSQTSLANLEDKSLILFGSYGKEDEEEFFQLDTVFVVVKSVPYNPSDPTDVNRNLFLIHATLEYYNISYLRAFPNQPYYPVQLSLYEGVKYEDKDENDGMYSFVPAKLYNNNVMGFPRVKIKNEDFPVELQGYIKNTRTEKFKNSKNIDTATIKRFWKEIVKISRSNCCVEGVEFH